MLIKLKFNQIKKNVASPNSGISHICANSMNSLNQLSLREFFRTQCARTYPAQLCILFSQTQNQCVPFKWVNAVAFNKGSSAARFDVVNVCMCCYLWRKGLRALLSDTGQEASHQPKHTDNCSPEHNHLLNTGLLRIAHWTQFMTAMYFRRDEAHEIRVLMYISLKLPWSRLQTMFHSS